MFHAIRCCVQPGDFVMFDVSSNRIGVGEITDATIDKVKLKLFKPMDSETVKNYMIKPISATDYSVAAQDGMVELYQTTQEIYVLRSKIKDIAFILSVDEVESGMFHLAGAENTFFVRFMLVNNTMKPCNRAVYFARYLIEPLGVRLFTAMNTLSQHLRRAMYHLAESEVSSRSFCLPLFSMESFMYLSHKIQGHAVGTSIMRNQCVTKYLNTLKMECYVKTNVLTYVRILTAPALNALRKILGTGIGLGLTSGRPTKKNPVGYCTIRSIMTSLECGPVVPPDVILKPEVRCFTNGIDFIFSEQNRNLNCKIRFTKITISEAADAISRLATAEVTTAESGIYDNVWFQHENNLLEVIKVNGDVVTCKFVEEDDQDNIQLPLGLVKDLVARFGS